MLKNSNRAVGRQANCILNRSLSRTTKLKKELVEKLLVEEALFGALEEPKVEPKSLNQLLKENLDILVAFVQSRCRKNNGQGSDGR